MAVHRQCLGEEVSQVLHALAPENIEHSVADAVTNPVIAHVDGFGALSLDAVVCQTHSAGVITEKWRLGLLVSEGSEHSAQPDAMLSVDVKQPAYSASTTELHTVGMMQLTASRAPLTVTVSFALPQYSRPPATERPAERERYEASD